MRKSIQLPPPAAPVVTVVSQTHVSGARKLQLSEVESITQNLTENDANTQFCVNNAPGSDHGCRTSSKRLTRSALNKTLLERDSESSAQETGLPLVKKHPPSMSSALTITSALHAPSRVSVFDVRGLSRLKATFSALDNSVKDVVMGREKGENEDGINILAPDVVSSIICWIAELLPSISFTLSRRTVISSFLEAWESL